MVLKKFRCYDCAADFRDQHEDADNYGEDDEDDDDDDDDDDLT